MPRRKRASPPSRAVNVLAPFKPTFDWIARSGMAYCVRHAGFVAAREHTIIAALTLFNEEKHERIEPDAADIGIETLEQILRSLMIRRWLDTRQPLADEFRGKTYRLTGRKVGEPPSVVRRRVIGMNVLFRALLADEPFPDAPGSELDALADREPDIALITDYLYLHLTEEEEAAVVERLGDDADFFEKVWALVRVREMGLKMEDFMDLEGNLLTLPQFSDESSPLYAFPDGSWRVKFPISDKELALMWELFKNLRAKILAGGADPGHATP